jgi:hypothetical protein
VAAVAGLIAHGGLAGAIAESLIAVAVAAVLLAVWIRERRVSRLRREDDGGA